MHTRSLIPFLLLLSISTTACRKSRPLPETSTSFEEAAAEIMGRTLAERLPQGGTVLIVTDPPYTDALLAAHQRQRDFLARGWGGQKFKQVGLQHEKVSLSEEESQELSHITAEALVERWRQNPDVVAILLIAMDLAPSPGFQFPSDFPPLYVIFRPLDSIQKSLLTSGWVDAGVYFKTDSDSLLAAPATADVNELFHLRYLRITRN